MPQPQSGSSGLCESEQRLWHGPERPPFRETDRTDSPVSLYAATKKRVHSECHDDVPPRIYNIGDSEPVRLPDLIHTIEDMTGRKASMKMIDIQPGDVVRTHADTSELQKDFGYKPSTSIHQGISRLYEWTKQYGAVC